MEEDIQILKEWLEVDKKAFNNLFRESMVLPKKEYCELYSKRIKALENLIKEFKEYKKFADITLMKSNTKFAEVVKDSIYFDYIPKSKIKEKIEEYEKAIEESNYDKLKYSKFETSIRIDELQELLEDK